MTPNESLNRGGQGKIFQGRDNEMQILVAIKRSETPDKKLDRYSVFREFIRAMEIPQHPNLARYYDAYRLKSDMGWFDFGVMELIEGGKNLDDFMKGLPTEDVIKSVLIGILSGLEHLHRNNVIHRDLKPANILIDEDTSIPTPKIIDFGISKELGREETVASMVVGTAEYMAPEQLNPPKDMPIHRNTDLWAFGVILYRMFLSSMPFGTVEEGRNTKEEIHGNILSAEIPVDISEIPEPYQTIIRGCLIRNVSKRFQSAQQIIDILEGKVQIQPQNTPGQDTRIEGMAAGGPVSAKRKQKNSQAKKQNRLIIGLFTAIAALIVTFTALFLFDTRSENRDSLQDYLAGAYEESTNTLQKHQEVDSLSAYGHYLLGAMYYEGLHNETFIPIFDEAVPLLEEASKEGVMEAYLMLGDLYKKRPPF
jgi:serine/threonine protein kinase